jgi:hypothetical protein
MRTFTSALLAISAEAVNLQGAYEHDHYNHVPYTLTTYEPHYGTHLEPIVDHITKEIRGEEVYFHQHSDSSGFQSYDSDSTVQTIISFESVRTHDHSDEYSESGYGLLNSDYWSSQSGVGGGFYRDHNGNLDAYVDYTDDDKIGFVRDADGYIIVYTESDDPFETDDGYYDDYAAAQLGPGGYGGYYGRGIYGPYGGLGPFDGKPGQVGYQGLGNGGYGINGLNDLGYGGYLGGVDGRGYGYGAFNDHSYAEHGYGDHGHETSDYSYDSDGSSYSHSHSSYSIHTFDSTHDTHFHIDEYVTDITVPILDFEVVEHVTDVPYVRPAFFEEAYTHPDHDSFRYDFNRREGYGYEYETSGGLRDIRDPYPYQVPLSRGLNVPAYDRDGRPQLYATFY